MTGAVLEAEPLVLDSAVRMNVTDEMRSVDEWVRVGTQYHILR